jgi:hypothetical protein
MVDACNLHGSCMEAAWKLHGSCLEAVQLQVGQVPSEAMLMHGSCLESAWTLPGICLESARKLHGSCLEAGTGLGHGTGPGTGPCLGTGPGHGTGHGTGPGQWDWLRNRLWSNTRPNRNILEPCTVTTKYLSLKIFKQNIEHATLKSLSLEPCMY